MSLISQSRLILLGLVAACLVLTTFGPTQAGVAPISPPSLFGAWSSTWKIEGKEVSVRLTLREDGRYLFLVLDSDGQIIQKIDGRFIIAPANVLTWELHEQRLVEKVRWLDTDHFVFAGSEDHPWQRLHLSK